MSHQACKSDRNCDLCMGWPRKREKRREKKVISQPICTEFDEYVDLTDVMTPAMFGSKIFINYSRPRGGKKHFPFRKANGLYNSATRYRAGL